MNEANILENILQILEDNSIEVRRESLGGSGGGLCKIKDKTVFFVDRQAGTVDTAVIAAQAVKECIDIEKTYITPETREFIENADV
jgi:predicted phosphoribosyltransferase